MKRLLIMRHAKSDWNAGVADDHARPLNDRGLEAAPAMGRLLTEIGEIPDLILSSTAMRARTTAELAKNGGEWDAEIVLLDELYGNSPFGVLEQIKGTADKVRSLMVVGHQPTLGGLVQVLTGGQVAMKTATVAVINLMVGQQWDWDDMLQGELITLLQPRHLERYLSNDELAEG